MKTNVRIKSWLVLAVAILCGVSVSAEEKANPVMTALSSTSISGYVDTSAVWHFGGTPLSDFPSSQTVMPTPIFFNADFNSAVSPLPAAPFSPSGNLQAAPEPSTLGLIAIGGLLFGVLKHRFRIKS